MIRVWRKICRPMCLAVAVSGVLLAILQGGCGSSSGPTAQRVPVPEKGLFLQCNVHVTNSGSPERPRYTASYLGNVDPARAGTHQIIPVNTEILFMRSRGGFAFRMANERDVVRFTYNPGHTRMRVGHYQKRLAAAEPRSLDNFSELEMKGIEEGKALVGMSKEAVVVALGYPSAHRTRSLEARAYVYWRDGRKLMTVQFDYNGKVSGVR